MRISGEEDIMFITVSGVLIRVSVSDISQMGRNTQGVKVIRLGDEEFVSTVAKVQTSEDEDEVLDELDEHEETDIIIEAEETEE